MPNPTAGNCFHPIDEPTADGPADMCLDPADACYRPGDDLAADLHRALTDADERDLAALAVRP
jgi:hypothetical protein